MTLCLWLHGLRRRVTDVASGSTSVTNIEQATHVSRSQVPHTQNRDKLYRLHMNDEHKMHCCFWKDLCQCKGFATDYKDLSLLFLLFVFSGQQFSPL